MLPIDHLLAAFFAIGFPAITTPVYARRRALLRAGDVETKRREYSDTVMWLAGMGVATLVVWTSARRDLQTLGLSVELSWRSAIGLTVAAAGAALLILQVRGVRRNPEAQDATRNALEPVREFLPSSESEHRLFRTVAFSAGIGEELFYRGFLIWYFGQFMPVIWAVIASSIFFGMAHIMHGRAATIRATLIGVVLAGLYLGSGSLWPSMVLHTAIDLSNGAIGRAVYGGDSAGPPANEMG